MTFQSILLRAAVLGATATLLSGCLVMAAAGAAGAVVGTAVGVTGKAVVMTAKGAGAVVGAVIPGGDKKKDEKSGG
jgi:hypothetical protein